ncbi:MAG TPA: transposase [Stellaceae bacterium]|nr:transposase [Stellaceae bacterium]
MPGGAISTGANPSARVRSSFAPAIDLPSADIGAPGHLPDHHARRQALGNNRPLLFRGPAPPTFRTGDHLNSRHRTVSCTGARTVICTDASRQPPIAVSAQGGPHRTVTAGLRRSGITAPCVFDGAINGERFRGWVEQMLAPTLRADDVVLLDNLSSHKITGIAEAVTAQGAQLVYLPPYSPDLNPIEQAFAKFKAALSQAAERTREGLWQLIGQTLDRYPPQECRNFFDKAGYAT